MRGRTPARALVVASLAAGIVACSVDQKPATPPVALSLKELM